MDLTTLGIVTVCVFAVVGLYDYYIEGRKAKYEQNDQVN